ncbi:MAG TPA: hypothetical protein VKM93_27290 [Terriglobia bacterium]|nr:hypothetical protein [Terriglobia bacterium]
MKVEELIDQVYCLVMPLIQGDHVPCKSEPGFRMRQAIIGVAACVLFGTLTLAAQGDHIFRGEVCLEPAGGAAILEKSQAMEHCTVGHARRGAHYVLSNLEKKTVYQLDAHKQPRDFAGNHVVVVGTLDKAGSTIHVFDMFRALPPKVMRAKSAYIDCDACPRDMATAWLAAFEGLTDWGRFDIVPDPRKADLIFLLSANPYLGDYLTRDRPDKRPVRVDITYMDVVDPRTGESLWGGSRQWGAWFVGRATKDLILEFKQELALEEKF